MCTSPEETSGLWLEADADMCIESNSENDTKKECRNQYASIRRMRPSSLADTPCVVVLVTPRLSEEPHFHSLAERMHGGLNLIEPRGVSKIEQPVDLRHMPAESACEFGLPDPLCHHLTVQGELCGVI